MEIDGKKLDAIDNNVEGQDIPFPPLPPLPPLLRLPAFQFHHIISEWIK